MVLVAVRSAAVELSDAVPLVTPVSVIITVSPPSTRLSSITGTLIVALVVFAEMVTAPDSAV